MKNEILVKLRNILSKLYSDEASMRRISHDAGLDLTRVLLNSSATNNWHSILSEAENVNLIDTLLTVVLQEYSSNQALLSAYQTYRQTASQPNPNDDLRPTLNTGRASVGNNVQAGDEFGGRDQINFIVSLGRWEKVRRMLFEVPVPQAIQEQFQSFDWSKAEHAYLDKVNRLYDRVRILGNSVDVPLGNLFTQVYILDKPTAHNRHDIEELRKRGYDRPDFQRQPGERMQGLELVKTGQNLFILGKPGAGKTTFLKYITIQAARKQLPCIPIFISLNEWADSRWGKGDKAALLPFLVEQFDICDFPDATIFINYLLREGRALVLFDGLDEVKQEKDQRRRLTRLIQDFTRKYSGSQYLITCRIAATDYAFTGFADVEVADFTPNQVKEYARNWFGTNEKKFKTFIADLAKRENKGLAELGKTPLLLSLLCLTFDNMMRFPLSRSELYEDSLETLLRKWDSSRQIQRDEIYRELSHKRKLQLLMRIAAPTFEKGDLFLHQRDLEKRISDYLVTLPSAPSADSLDTTAILKAMEAQHGVLVERAQGIYSFSHLTFQEYLTARSLAENQGKGAANKLIHSHLTDQRWREVFLLTANLVDDADDFIAIVHNTTDNLLVDTPPVKYLLTWAHRKAENMKAPIERYATIQLAYIFLSLSLALARRRAEESNIPRVHILVRDLGIELDCERSHNDTQKLARRSALDRAFAHSLELATIRSYDLRYTRTHKREFVKNLIHKRLLLELIVDLAKATTPLVGFDYGLYCAWIYATLFGNVYYEDQNWRSAIQNLPDFIVGIATLGSEGGLSRLAQELLMLSIPSSSALEEDWQQYADDLFIILRDIRDLGRDWIFTSHEIDKLNNYLYATELLVQCVKIAAVSNRQSVLNGLLLPLEVDKMIDRVR